MSDTQTLRNLNFFLWGPHHFWFDWLVEWACPNEGKILSMGHCLEYKSTRGADGCCHVLVNSEGLHRHPVFLPMLNFFQIFQTSHIGALLRLTHTHSPLLPGCLWSDTAADWKCKHSHSLKHTHGHAQAFVSTVERLSNFTSCQSHPHSYLQNDPLMAERTVYFSFNKWPHTQRGCLILLAQLLQICFPSACVTV